MGGFKGAGIPSGLGIFKKQDNSVIAYLNKFYLGGERNRTNMVIGEDAAVTRVSQVSGIFEQCLNFHSTLPVLRHVTEWSSFYLLFSQSTERLWFVVCENLFVQQKSNVALLSFPDSSNTKV